MLCFCKHSPAKLVAQLVAVCCFSFLPVLVSAQQGSLERDPGEPVSGDRPQASVLDYSHGYVTQQFDTLARWIDGFFGTRRADAETANSFVRLRYEMRFEESGETGNKLRLRGKVSLPLLDERLKLVFFDDEEDELLPGQSLDDTELERDNTGGVGLQYSIAERRKFRLDYRLGVRSGNELRTGVRLRYALPLSERNQVRFTENIYWQDNRGFGTKSVVDLERALNERQLLRWSNRFDFTEDTRGLPWRSVVSFNHIFKRDHAVAYYFRADGETRPDYITTDYGPGFLYRINLFKKWFFLEFEPSYLWKRLPDTNKHEGVGSLTVRFEILFSDQHTLYPALDR
ncbi:MAG: hypothetical protein KJO24_02295 [Gammaproteobacteria bacterium]|nr:hypothetical protein [Gammaproteobacteria bacterium]